MEQKNYNDLFVPTFSRTGSPMVRGEGMYLVDADGKRYLDFGSGIAVSALGHSHPRLVSVLKDQGDKLLHLSNLYFSQPQIDLAAMLVEHSFGKKVFLCNSGTEAIEAAIKFSRKWASKTANNKYHILSFYKGFHGRTYGALSATAQAQFHDGFGPMLEGFHYATLNDIAGTKAVLDKYDFSAIIVEPVQGEGGVNVSSKEFLSFLRDYAAGHGVALVFDEIQCGMGRTARHSCGGQAPWGRPAARRRDLHRCNCVCHFSRQPRNNLRRQPACVRFGLRTAVHCFQTRVPRKGDEKRRADSNGAHVSCVKIPVHQRGPG
jgi:acetylornithine/N-succinyldiaminopimelate aminotransferase